MLSLVVKCLICLPPLTAASSHPQLPADAETLRGSSGRHLDGVPYWFWLSASLAILGNWKVTLYGQVSECMSVEEREPAPGFLLLFKDTGPNAGVTGFSHSRETA